MLERFLPRGLLARTLLILILPVFVLQALGVYLFYERHWDKLAQRLSTSVAGDVALVAEWYEQDASFLEPAQRIRLKRYIELDVSPGVASEDAKDKVRYDYLTTALRNALDGRPYELYNPAGRNYTAIVTTARGPITIEIPKRRLYSSTAHIFIIWMGGLTIVLLVIAALLLNRQIKPILKLAAAAWQQGKPVELKLEGAEEVRRATAGFLDMQERIKRDKDQRDAILIGAREDLQKPIDRVRLMLETVLSDHPDTPGMIADLRAMERMIDGYLSYVRDNKDEPVQVVSIRDVLAEAERLAGARRLTIDSQATPHIDIMARPLALTRAFANIIRNASTYGGDLLVVETRLIDTDDGRMMLMCLEDNGPGMNEKAMRDALHPMERGRSVKGFGLAIAADIIAGHEGRLELSKGVKGLRVTIMMPA